MKNEIFSDTETFFLSLADKTRLRLLNLMRHREVNVNSLVEALGESQPKISRHLAVLRNAQIIELRRDGKWVYYKIAEPKNDFAANVLRHTLEWLDSQKEMRRENENFIKTRGTSEETEQINFSHQADVSEKTNMSEYKRSELAVFLL